LVTCTTFWESLTPSKRRTAAYIALCYLLLKRVRDPSGPRLELINEDKYEELQWLAQLPENRDRRSSHFGDSQKFAATNSYMAYKDSPFGGCALALLGSTISSLLSQSAPHPPPRTSGLAFLLPALQPFLMPLFTQVRGIGILGSWP
jgi:hypothetical protein